MPGITSYAKAFKHAIDHPLFVALDDDSLKQLIGFYDYMAAEGIDAAAGIADAIRVMLVNRKKGVAV